MSKFMVEHVIDDESTILRTFETKDEAMEWAKENYRTFTRDGGIVCVTLRMSENKWRTYEVFR